jgi:hypothetical protein
MTNGFLKKTGQTAADQARKTAKQIAQEPYEIVKTVVPQHVLEGAKKNSSPPVSKIFDKVEKQPEEIIDKEAVNAQARKRLQELEEEIGKIRKQRKVEEEEWKKNQESLMQPEQPSEKPFVEPPAKKKQGFMGFAKKKQGTKEMGKQISG